MVQVNRLGMGGIIKKKEESLNKTILLYKFIIFCLTLMLIYFTYYNIGIMILGCIILSIILLIEEVHKK